MSSQPFKVNAFPPSRPVEGTICVRPDAEQLTPRVFLADDIVPPGTPVLAPNNYIIPAQRREYRIKTAGIAMTDLPPFGELVEAEKARRTGGEGAE